MTITKTYCDRCGEEVTYNDYSELFDFVDALPSVTPSYNSIKTELKPCEDCISREDAKNLFWDGTEGYDCRGFTRKEMEK